MRCYRKFLCLTTVVLGVSFSVVGCAVDSGDGDINSAGITEETKVEETKVEETKVEEKDTYIVGDVLKLRDMSLQVVDVTTSSGGEYSKPKEGNEYVIVDVILRNDSDKSTKSYSPYHFSMANSNGQITNTEFTMVDMETALSLGELSPGGIVRGTLSYEQPKGDNGIKLIYNNNILSDKEVIIDLSKKLDSFDLIVGDKVTVSDDIPKIGEPMELNGARIVVNKVERSSGNDFEKPKDGHEYVIVHIDIENIGNARLPYNAYDYRVRNSSGNITEALFITLNMDTALSSGELMSGGKVSGTLSFEQPIGDTELVLMYIANMFTNECGEIALK